MSNIPTTGNVVVISQERKVIISPVAAAGIGIPAGGQTDQALLKNSTADYDTVWADVVLSVTGDGVDNTDPKNPTLSFPDPGDIGAYPDTNPSGFVNAQEAADAAPVQSVNGDTGNVSVFDGGVTGDILVKNSSNNYDTSWTSNITVDSITYDTNAGIEPSVIGKTAWNFEARTISINKGNDVIQDISQDLNYPPSFNADSVTLTKGMLVMVDPSQPAQGQNLRIVRYVSNGTYPVDLFVGMVAESILAGELGFVEWFGKVQGLNVPTLQPMGETWAEGDILWPNPAVAGGLTKIEPSAPAHKVTVAAILRISGNNATVLMRPNLRSKISDLHDVQITNVSNSDVLTWNGTAWVNSTIVTGGVQSVTGDGVDNTDPANPVLSFPTLDEIGAYSNTNPDNFVNATAAAAAAPVQSVNGQTNAVNLALNDLSDVNVANVTGGQTLVYNATATSWQAVTIAAGGVQSVTGDGVDNTDPANPVLSFPTLDEIGAYSNTNPNNFVNAAGAAAAAPVQSVNGQTNVVTLGADDVGAYSNTNPANYINVAQAAAAAPVQSVNGQTNVVVLGADDVGAYSNTNPSNYINVAQAAAAAPVQSVNGQTNVVVLTADDVGAYSNTNPSGYVNATGAAAAAPIQTVTGDGVDNTNVGNVVISFPTLDQIGAYSNTNPANYINVAQASAAAPVQSVNGQTNVVVLGADDVGAYSNTNPSNYINVAQAAAAAPVQSVNGQTNVVVLGADDVGAYSNTNPSGYVNATGAAAAAPIQTVTGDGVDNTNVGNVVISFPTLDQIGAYSNTNPANYINVAQAAAAAPVQSVNGQTNVVVLTADDVGAYSNTNPASYVNAAGAAAAAPIQSVTGTLVTGTTADPVINIPTADQVGAYSNTNPAGYVNAAGAAAAAPIQTVTGDGVNNTNVGNVVISFPTLDQIGAYSNTNPLSFVNATGAAAAAPVQSVNGQTGNVNVNVSSLTDTNIVNAADGEVLTYQSGEWVNAAGGGGQSVSSLQIVYLSQVYN